MSLGPLRLEVQSAERGDAKAFEMSQLREVTPSLRLQRLHSPRRPLLPRHHVSYSGAFFASTQLIVT